MQPHVLPISSSEAGNRATRYIKSVALLILVRSGQRIAGESASALREVSHPTLCKELIAH